MATSALSISCQHKRQCQRDCLSLSSSWYIDIHWSIVSNYFQCINLRRLPAHKGAHYQLYYYCPYHPSAYLSHYNITNNSLNWIEYLIGSGYFTSSTLYYNNIIVDSIFETIACISRSNISICMCWKRQAEEKKSKIQFSFSRKNIYRLKIWFPFLYVFCYITDDDSDVDVVTDYLSNNTLGPVAQPYAIRDYSNCVGVGHDGPVAAANHLGGVVAHTESHYNRKNLKLNKNMTHHQPAGMAGHQSHHMMSASNNGTTANNHHHHQQQQQQQYHQYHANNNNNHINNNIVPIISVTPHSPGSKYNNILGTYTVAISEIIIFRLVNYFIFFSLFTTCTKVNKILFTRVFDNIWQYCDDNK